MAMLGNRPDAEYSNRSLRTQFSRFYASAALLLCLISISSKPVFSVDELDMALNIPESDMPFEIILANVYSCQPIIRHEHECSRQTTSVAALVSSNPTFFTPKSRVPVIGRTDSECCLSSIGRRVQGVVGRWSSLQAQFAITHFYGTSLSLP